MGEFDALKEAALAARRAQYTTTIEVAVVGITITARHQRQAKVYESTQVITWTELNAFRFLSDTIVKRIEEVNADISKAAWEDHHG